MKIDVSSNNHKFFQALGSNTRITVLEILREENKNIGELAALLNVSSAIMTRHITLLEEVGLVKTINVRGKRGLQKICSLAEEEIIINLAKNLSSFSITKAINEIKSISIPIGQYINYEIQPTCGLASTEKLIGICDDPRYFSTPDRYNAAILWFQSGFVEYSIPGYLLTSKEFQAIEISLELCSEFPHYNETWQSDIYFYLNNILIGIWTCPGDFGANRGTYTPDWWRNGTQYGLLKNIKINNNCTMLDGTKFSNITLKDIGIELNKDLNFRIASPKNAINKGGINLFGKGFGNYDQNIEIRIE
jgi:predicted transcriptional regulator